MFNTVYLIDNMENGYYDENRDDFHDYEEDAMQSSHWPSDSANDIERDEDDRDDMYDDEFQDDDNPYREDLGWDGGREN